MTMNLNEAYLALQEASGIKIGDTVRVLRKASNFEMGWGDLWADSVMDEYIGREWLVTDIDGDSGVVLSNGRSFPFFVLEKTKDAPRFIEINGHKVPEPEREALERGEGYWTPNINTGLNSLRFTWHGDATDNYCLSRGLVHKTKEAAEIHAKALLSFTENTGEARNDR